jgi:hypothetical protein
MMSEPAAKRPSMDFDEFERRLRVPEPVPQAAGHDPLAELARLVDGHPDPYADMFRQATRAKPPELRAVQPGETAPRMAAAPQVPVPPVEVPGAEDWQIRRDEWPPSFQQAETPAPAAIQASEAEPPYESYAAEDYETPRPAKSRKGLYLMVASMAAVAAGVGATVLTRGGSHTPQDAPIIKAEQGPMKIVPAAPAATTDTVRTATILERTDDQLNASKVVGREEQPIDIAAARSVRQAQAPAAAPPATTTLFPEPRRVRTIPVRPDGTLVNEPAPALKPAGTVAAATPAPTLASRPTTTASIVPPAMPKPAMPESSPPTPSAELAPKTTARVAPPAKPAEPRPVVASRPVALSGAVVDRSPAASAGAGGGFAVQLAATSSDAEAREQAGRFAGQFSSALGGRRPTVLHGQANGRSVYRIRVTGLSREEATAMCGKIKGGGGACFVAH